MPEITYTTYTLYTKFKVRSSCRTQTYTHPLTHTHSHTTTHRDASAARLRSHRGWMMGALILNNTPVYMRADTGCKLCATLRVCASCLHNRAWCERREWWKHRAGETHEYAWRAKAHMLETWRITAQTRTMWVEMCKYKFCIQSFMYCVCAWLYDVWRAPPAYNNATVICTRRGRGGRFSGEGELWVNRMRSRMDVFIRTIVCDNVLHTTCTRTQHTDKMHDAAWTWFV